MVEISNLFSNFYQVKKRKRVQSKVWLSYSLENWCVFLYRNVNPDFLFKKVLPFFNDFAKLSLVTSVIVIRAGMMF